MSSHMTPLNPTRRGFGAVALGTLAAAGTASALTAPRAAAAPAAPAAEGPQPTPHTQKAYDPIDSDFHGRWTCADARQIMRTQNDTSVERGENSMPESITMPEIPKDFPIMTDEVWVWDTWSLTDEHSNQMSYKGWDVIFSLVAPRDIPFDERHWSARIGYFTRPSSADPDEAWTYGGYLFEDETSLSTPSGPAPPACSRATRSASSTPPPPSARSAPAPTASPPCSRPCSARSRPPRRA